MEIKTYYPQLDQLKGLAILLMVMGHAIAWSYPDYTFLTTGKMCEMAPEVFNASIIWKIIYSFHMPLLFFVSGYLFYKQDKEWTGTFVITQLKKRILRLLVPYFTTGAFVLYLKGYFGYWFFIVLFVINVIVLFELFAIERIKIKSFAIEISIHIAFFIFLYVSSKFYRDLLPKSLSNLSGLYVYYLVFVFGYLMHKYQKLETFLLRPAVSFGAFIAYVGIMIVLQYYGIMSQLSFLIPITAIVFLYNVFINSKLRFLGGVGLNSMEIYVFHLFFVAPFQEVGQYILGLSSLPLSITIQLVYSLLVSSIAIFFSLITSKVIKSNSIMCKLIFGK